MIVLCHSRNGTESRRSLRSLQNYGLFLEFNLFVVKHMDDCHHATACERLTGVKQILVIIKKLFDRDFEIKIIEFINSIY